MQMHTPMGYCTLRNGTKQSANIGAPVSMVSKANFFLFTFFVAKDFSHI